MRQWDELAFGISSECFHIRVNGCRHSGEIGAAGLRRSKGHSVTHKHANFGIGECQSDERSLATRTPAHTNANKHQQTPTNAGMRWQTHVVDTRWCLLAFAGGCWCLIWLRWCISQATSMETASKHQQTPANIQQTPNSTDKPAKTE